MRTLGVGGRSSNFVLWVLGGRDRISGGSCRTRSAGQLVRTAHAISMENIETFKEEEATGSEG